MSDRADRPDRLDRRAAVAMAALAIVVALLNVDRFVLGKTGPLRAHDLADSTVTTTAAGGEIWRSALRSSWDGSQLRGFPRMASAQHPQTLWALTGAAVATERVLPVLFTMLQIVMTVGSFLFVRCFLQRSHETAVAGAVLSVVLFFFFHEHPVVTSAVLLAPLAGYLSVPASSLGWRALQVGGAVLVMTLSNPTSTLFAMPLGHLALILLAPRGARPRHFALFACFWLAYALYYAPTLMSQLREFGQSSRSLYRPSPRALSYLANLKEMLLNPAVISPAAVFVVMVNRRTWFKALIFVVLVVAGIALAAANQILVGSDLAQRFPLLLAISTMYYRMYYFVPVAVLVWATWIWQDDERPRPLIIVRRALGLAAFCVLIGWPLAYTNWATVTVFEPYWRYALVLGLSMAFGLTWWTRRMWTTAIVAGAVIFFARYEYTRIWEVPFQGNLFLEEPHLGQPRSAGRSVTVMSTCDGVDLFPAQARAAGVDTLDGISNLYDRGFVERWRYFVADNPALCTSRYAAWPTRAEVTVSDLEYAPDRILPWFWINNVEFVRAPRPLAYPELELLDQRAFTYDKVQRVTRYLYRMRNPVGRVFTVPDAIAGRAASAELAVEEAALADLVEQGGLARVDAVTGDGSHLRFSGAFEPGRTVVANVNYHRNWRLRIDGTPSPLPVEPGPFGMVAFDPPDGNHDYELAYVQPAVAWIPVCMVTSAGLLWLTMGRRHVSRRGLRWLTAAAALASVGLLVGVVARSGAQRAPSGWLDGPWTHRMAVQTPGAQQTAPLSNFPLRVEYTASDSEFWQRIQATGRDLRMSAADGRTLLPFEIEELDVARHRLVAWVKIPELPTGPGTVAYLYFGNPEASPAASGQMVWDAHYEGVWHLNPRRAAADGHAADSTRHGRTALLHDIALSASDSAPGISFDGVRSWVEIPDWPGLASANGDWTIEFLVQPAPKNRRNFELLEHGSDGVFNSYLHNGGFLVLERRNGDRVTESGFSRSQLEDGRWTAVTISRTRGHLRLALDGVTREAVAVPPAFRDGPANAPLKIGLGLHGRLEGRVAEVRISRGIARTADWALANFRSLSGSLVTFGEPVTR